MEQPSAGYQTSAGQHASAGPQAAAGQQDAAGYLEPPALQPPAPAVVRGPHTTAWLLRILITLHALAALAQPVLAGAYLQGAFDALGLHSGNAILVLLLCLFAAIACVPYWLRNGAGWPILVLSALWLVEGLQLAMGYGFVLAVNIPVGVLVVGVAVWLLVWAWSPASRGPRLGAR
jgi:hypothetical protein